MILYYIIQFIHQYVLLRYIYGFIIIYFTFNSHDPVSQLIPWIKFFHLTCRFQGTYPSHWMRVYCTAVSDVMLHTQQIITSFDCHTATGWAVYLLYTFSYNFPHFNFPTFVTGWEKSITGSKQPCGENKICSYNQCIFMMERKLEHMYKFSLLTIMCTNFRIHRVCE
jgi:hypothetical protein